jgi:hypothetical protein
MDYEKVFVEILQENWRHARHVESERMWFANIFAAIFAGTIAYLSQVGLSRPPLVLLIILALFCLLVTIKINAAFGDHIRAIRSIFEDKKIYIGTGTKWRKYIGLPKRKGWWWKVCRVGLITIFFYIAVILFLLYMIIWIA